ncbi:claudin-23 [Denticeps clupeoides]|uniref:Claudin n=1 Tax=Denticeps clupeoides TaxID=299321 RepID=A0AAY4ACL5_9TELE|nr:claudin-23-like [Denticeps clupeoides]XP_028843631.1 claudin-23-like [Denticeps clupeoides]XP_028843639.1 claudin-23-like [Denticeps clupeoides]
MQTPASMVTGIVFAPLGLALVFTAAITPQWREGQTLVGVGGGGEALLLRSDGLWESCLQVVHSELKRCWPASGAYRRDGRVRLAQGLVLASLFLCGAGIVLASVGVRCWTDLPLRGVAAAGGLSVALAGVLSLTALAVYTHYLLVLGAERLPQPTLPKLTLRPAGSLYFGWVGGCVQLLGGVALLLSFKRPRCPSCPKPAAADTEAYEVNC